MVVIVFNTLIPECCQVFKGKIYIYYMSYVKLLNCNYQTFLGSKGILEFFVLRIFIFPLDTGLL